jgi:hypothetical protein
VSVVLDDFLYNRQGNTGPATIPAPVKPYAFLIVTILKRKIALIGP